MAGFDLAAIYAFLQVTMIDLVLAGDNAIVIGMAAAGLEKQVRGKAILLGILAATVLRIVFALIATKLLAFTGLLVAGGVLLLWVCWKMWRELRAQRAEEVDALAADCTAQQSSAPSKTLREAVTQIIVADVSMSLDNVLAVAGAAYQHIEAMIFGLVLSVFLMGAASSVIAIVLHRFRWLAWIGLLIVLYVAINMVYDGMEDVTNGGLPDIPLLKN